jgi:hypothetical protein
MLCVDIHALKINKEYVQRNVNIEDIINNHTKHFNDMEQAYKESYVPLDFCVCVRSIYDNTVMQIDGENKKLYYQNCTNVPLLPHKGYDLAMYMSSIGLMQNIDFEIEFNDLMMRHSQYNCIGLFNPAPLLINPIVVSHIIMSDEGMKELSKFLKKGVEIVPIQDMKKEGNLIPILDTLIIVKKEESHE